MVDVQLKRLRMATWKSVKNLVHRGLIRKKLYSRQIMDLKNKRYLLITIVRVLIAKIKKKNTRMSRIQICWRSVKKARPPFITKMPSILIKTIRDVLFHRDRPETYSN